MVDRVGDWECTERFDMISFDSRRSDPECEQAGLKIGQVVIAEH